MQDFYFYQSISSHWWHWYFYLSKVLLFTTACYILLVYSVQKPRCKNDSLCSYVLEYFLARKITSVSPALTVMLSSNQQRLQGGFCLFWTAPFALASYLPDMWEWYQSFHLTFGSGEYVYIPKFQTISLRISFVF